MSCPVFSFSLEKLYDLSKISQPLSYEDRIWNWVFTPNLLPFPLLYPRYRIEHCSYKNEEATASYLKELSQREQTHIYVTGVLSYKETEERMESFSWKVRKSFYKRSDVQAPWVFLCWNISIFGITINSVAGWCSFWALHMQVLVSSF